MKRIPHAMKYVRQEIQILQSLHHTNVISLHTSWFDEEKDKMYIITEYVPGGCLATFIKNKSRLSEGEARTIFSGLMEGLKYLHSQGIVHGDIKPDNPLLTL